MQISDDPELLKLMLEDTSESPDFYKPTNYWALYEKKFLPELEKYGLHDFRRRKSSILSSFGATDLSNSLGQIDLFKNRIFNNRITRKIPLWSKLLSFQNTLLNKTFPVTSAYKVEEFERMFYELSRMYGKESGARPIEEFEASLAGNPEQVIKIGPRAYTISILWFYLQYAYCCNFLNFDNIEIMTELGGGAGKQVEVIKKLHPDTCFLLFDIPPQLYVCEQYLSSIFPNDVISYRDTKHMDSLPEDRKGKIFIFGNWKFPILEKTPIDLFWNATSFQEMEPDVVANYLKFVNETARAVYLLEAMEGKEVASKEGSHGVLKQTTMEDYQKGLENFKLREGHSPYWPTLTRSNHDFSFWERNNQ